MSPPCTIPFKKLCMRGWVAVFRRAAANGLNHILHLGHIAGETLPQTLPSLV